MHMQIDINTYIYIYVMYISPQQNKKNNKDQQKWSTCEYDGVLFTELDLKKNMLSLLSTKISLEHMFFRRAEFTEVSRWRF